MVWLHETCSSTLEDTGKMTYLTEHLPFASSSNHALPPPKWHLLVTDTLTSPAHFVLYHLISAALLDKRKVSLFVCTSHISRERPAISFHGNADIPI